MNIEADQIQLIPPYCPNSSCLFHFGTNKKFYVKNGWTLTQRPPFKNQRYVCKECGTQFSANTFSIDFRKKIPGIFSDVLEFSMNGMSNNSIARRLKVAEPTIRNRLTDLARQSLLFEKEHFPKAVDENFSYDGFETFTHSQFSPCYVNTAVGSLSHFIYHNTLSPLNRKGRMTREQKIKNAELLTTFGAYPKDSVFKESRYILKSLSSLAPGRILFTDEHRAYLRAARSFDFKLTHQTINSRERRDPKNPLFPINRLHSGYRHFFSSQHRETIAFQKHEAALLEKMQLMKIYRNFMRTKYVKKNSYDKHCHEWSPAMYLGVVDKVLGFDEVFQVRRKASQMRLDSREVSFVKRIYPYSRQKIAK
jgi:transposase-like protein